MDNVVDRAREIANDISKKFRRVVRRGKVAIKKSWDNNLEQVANANKRADERAKKKNSVLGTSTPHGGGTTSLNPMSTRNGGII